MKVPTKLLIILYTCLLILSQLPMGYALDSVDISPGRHDYKLGRDFPTEDLVKLDYPNSTILINSTGELLFNVTLTTFNYTSNSTQDFIVKSITIFIPPEFTINGGVASVWTSYSNDYNPSSITLNTALSNDPIAPNWSVLKIFNLNITRFQDNIDVKSRMFLENTTQYIRIFNVTSPSIAGRYFFKSFVGINGFTYSIGAKNFPTIVVKAALNPAYASGIIRYGDPLKPNLYGKPLDNTNYGGTILLPDGYGGKILAEGLTSKGRLVYSQAYFNASAEGRYNLYGLAPATYNVTIQAAGYPPKKFPEAFSVVKSQSLEGIDFYIEEGVNISGTVFSKHIHEKIPWGQVYDLYGTPKNRIIRVDITDLNEIVIASSPLRLYNNIILDFRPQDKLEPLKTDYNFFIKREVAFDGHIPQDYANYTSGISSGDYYVKAHATDYAQLDFPVIHLTNNTRELKIDIDLQRTNFFEIKIHFKNSPGNTKPMSTYTGGFLYLEVLDETGAVVGFNISYVPKGSSNFTMQVRGIDIWNRMAVQQIKSIAWIYSHDRGLLPGKYAINALFMNQTVDFIALNALILGSPELRLAFPTTTGPLVSAFSSETLELTNRRTPLYFQLSIIEATIGPFCNSATKLSFDLIRGGGFNITLYSVNWQRPATAVEWAHPNSRIQIDIQTSEGELLDTIYATQPLVGSSITISTQGEIGWENGLILFGKALGLNSGKYILKIYAPGYLEDEIVSPITIEITLGAISDIPIKIIRGAGINLTIVFKTENLFEPIDNTLCYARPIHNIDATPVRIEIFDEYGEFVDANTTYVRRGCSNLQVFLDGFNQYYGNPRVLWTNFYDTTDGNRQPDSGLDDGIYQIRVCIPGYYQHEILQTTIYSGEARTKPIISIETSIERLAYLSGTVDWINWIGIIYPMSWASITAYHVNGTEETYAYSLDGFYEMWLVSGNYDFGLYHPGFEIQRIDYGLHVTWGSCSFIRFLLHENWPPNTIPEFPASSLTILLALPMLLLFPIKRLLKRKF